MTHQLNQNQVLPEKEVSFVHDITLHNLHVYFKKASKNYFESFKEFYTYNAML